MRWDFATVRQAKAPCMNLNVNQASLNLRLGYLRIKGLVNWIEAGSPEDELGFLLLLLLSQKIVKQSVISASKGSTLPQGNYRSWKKVPACCHSEFQAALNFQSDRNRKCGKQESGNHTKLHFSPWTLFTYLFPWSTSHCPEQLKSQATGARLLVLSGSKSGCLQCPVKAQIG